MQNKLSIFTKPWKLDTVEELAQKVKSWGFDGVEFPLRDGYQAEPANAGKDLPRLAKELDAHGLKIFSVASSTDEHIFAACQEAGVPMIRIMCGFDPEEGYLAGEAKAKKELYDLQKLCEKYGVKVGVQHHYGYMVSNSMEMRHLLEGLDNNLIGAIWDAAHSGLAGEIPEQGLDIVWDMLMMVNLKTAYHKRVSGPEAVESQWQEYFTTAPHGMCPWSRVMEYLKKREYQGVICMPAEYTDEDKVEQYIVEDMAYVRKLMGK